MIISVSSATNDIHITNPADFDVLVVCIRGTAQLVVL